MAELNLKAEINRGAQDDLEVLKLIIEEHPGLKKRILAKIKVMRALNSESIEDAMARKKKDGDKNAKNRKRGS